MELDNNLKKPFILSIFLLLGYVPISEQRVGHVDVAETPAMAPNAPAMKDFKEVWMETHSPYAAPGAKRMDEIKTICSVTDYSSLCQSSVIPIFSTKGGDESSVLQLEIKAAIAETTSAISDADSLAISPETDDDTISSLDDCVSSYQSVLTDFKEAEAALGSKDKGTLNAMLSSAMSNIKSCNDGFDEPNPVAAKNMKITQLTSNCLAIAEIPK